MAMTMFGDRCEVQRRSVDEQAYGGSPSYVTHLENVPCRIEQRNERGVNSITAQWVTMTEWHLFVSPSFDIKEGDRVTNVKLAGETAVLQNNVNEAYVFGVDGSGGSGVGVRRGRATAVRKLGLKLVV